MFLGGALPVAKPISAEGSPVHPGTTPEPFSHDQSLNQLALTKLDQTKSLFQCMMENNSTWL